MSAMEKDNPVEALGTNQFWGFSPAVDLQEGSVVGAKFNYPETTASPAKAPLPPLHILVAGSSDIRHVLKTCALAHRHAPRELHLYLMEDCMETSAKQMLTWLLLLDTSHSQAVRMELFLELYGNILIQQKLVSYTGELAKVLLAHLEEDEDLSDDEEDVDADGSQEEGKERPLPTVFSHFDLSALKYRERDDLCQILRDWIKCKPLELKQQWDLRLRKFFGDRYDVRDNIIDWDYNLRGIKDVCSILHATHYKRWRNTGIAFELREIEYSCPNYTLASNREAREKKKGKIFLRGYWGDIMVTPYVGFGVESEEQSLFEIRNKQHVKNAWHVSEHNVLAWMHELSTGEKYKLKAQAAQEAKEKEAQKVRVDGKEGKSKEVPKTLTIVEEDEDDDSAAVAAAVEDVPIPAVAPTSLPSLRGVKIHILANDFPRLLKKSAYRQRFDRVHLAQSQVHKWSQEATDTLMKPGAICLVETIKYLPFKDTEKSAYVDKVTEQLGGCGWSPVGDKPTPLSTVIAFSNK